MRVVIVSNADLQNKKTIRSLMLRLGEALNDAKNYKIDSTAVKWGSVGGMISVHKLYKLMRLFERRNFTKLSERTCATEQDNVIKSTDKVDYKCIGKDILKNDIDILLSKMCALTM
jgi:hypothetical protein